MRSQARLTYTKVAAMLVDGDPALCAEYAKLLPHLHNLYQLYQALLTARARGAAPSTSTPTETRIVFNAERKVERIVPVVRNDAHRLIEECMLAANVAAAQLPAAAQAAGALPHPRDCRRPTSSRTCGPSWRSSACAWAAARSRTAKDYGGAAGGDPGAAGRPPHPDGPAALDGAGGLQPGERRPLRPGLPCVHPLHVADPALPRPPRAPRHQAPAAATARRTTSITPCRDCRASASTAPIRSAAPTMRRATRSTG